MRKLLNALKPGQEGVKSGAGRLSGSEPWDDTTEDVPFRSLGHPSHFQMQGWLLLPLLLVGDFVFPNQALLLGLESRRPSSGLCTRSGVVGLG